MNSIMQCTVSYCVAASEVSSVYNTPINWVGSPIDSVSNSSILDDSINTISNTTNKVGDWVGSQIDSVSNSYILDDSINTISNTTDKVGDWVGSQIDSVSNSYILDDSVNIPYQTPRTKSAIGSVPRLIQFQKARSANGSMIA